MMEMYCVFVRRVQNSTEKKLQEKKSSENNGKMTDKCFFLCFHKIIKFEGIWINII